MHPITAAFSNGPAFIPYLTAGDPDIERSRRFIEAVDAGGADIIELGLPFSEPIAEGPTIQSAIVRALEAGMTPSRYLELVDSLAVDAPIVCMTYYNLLAQYGDASDHTESLEAFVADATAVGVEGLIIPDLPIDEAAPLQSVCAAHDCALIFIVAPTTRGSRLDRIMDAVSGYLYVQARLGVTGARADVSTQTATSLERVADASVPRAVGFGITAPAQAREIVAAGADGIIVGSALIDTIADGIAAGSPTDAIATTVTEQAAALRAGARAGAPRAERP
jgi:tryptophan synthase, alpha chain (EC 4.2.1.20)